MEKKKTQKYHRTLKPTIFLFGEKNVLYGQDCQIFHTHRDQDVFNPTCENVYSLFHDQLYKLRTIFYQISSEHFSIYRFNLSKITLY